MMPLRVAVGLLLAAVYVGLAAPARALGLGTGASVGFHRLLCATLRVRWRRLGTPGPASRLIAANHVSWLDILVLGAIEPMAFLAKREVGANAWSRWLVDLQGVVYVDRKRKRCLPAVNAEMARKMASGTPVVLFAEATTSDGTRLLPFRSSHFEAARRAGAWVQPVYLDYIEIAGSATTRATKPSLAWYGDMPFPPSLWRVLACGGLVCEVHYGEGFACDAEPDRKRLAHRAEAAARDLKARAWRERGVAARTPEAMRSIPSISTITREPGVAT